MSLPHTSKDLNSCPFFLSLRQNLDKNPNQFLPYSNNLVDFNNMSKEFLPKKSHKIPKKFIPKNSHKIPKKSPKNPKNVQTISQKIRKILKISNSLNPT